MYRFSQNVQECTILLNFQKHCEQNVHSSHPEYHITHQRFNSRDYDS